jgi:hypothetical protein
MLDAQRSITVIQDYTMSIVFVMETWESRTQPETLFGWMAGIIAKELAKYYFIAKAYDYVSNFVLAKGP